MKLPPCSSLICAALLILPASTRAATVLTNLSGPAVSSILIKGNGGFIPAAMEYGFEFTVGGNHHILDSITVSIGTHFGSVPLTVELYESPTGPDSAVFLTALNGPPQPANQLATYSPPGTTYLVNGSTYFLRLRVAGSGSTYSIQETLQPATGDFLMGANYQRTAGSSWGGGDLLNQTLAEINATAIPEPSALAGGALGAILLLRRRRCGAKGC